MGRIQTDLEPPIDAAHQPNQGAATGFSHLTLTAFRNFRELSVELEPMPVVLTGKNGAGKSNLLEAISFLAPGAGMRNAGLGEVDCRGNSNQPRGAFGAVAGGPAWAVHGLYAGRRGEYGLGTGRDPLGPSQTGRERRVSRVNGAPARSQATFAEILTVLWLTPQMDRLFSDAASSRRRFLDRLVYGLDPNHAARIGAYEQAMRERARILRGEAPETGAEDRASWLTGLETEMAAQAVAIAAARLDAATRLNGAMEEAVGPFPRAGIAADGAVEAWLGEVPALEAEERLKQRLAESRQSDAAAGTTQWGAHRCDLGVTYLGRNLGQQPLQATDCSTGEQKSLLISILLAQARLLRSLRGEAPVLLLDEVVAHLDAERRAYLFGEILGLGAQPWLTGTEADLFKPLRGRAQFFTVSDARLTRELV